MRRTCLLLRAALSSAFFLARYALALARSSASRLAASAASNSPSHIASASLHGASPLPSHASRHVTVGGKCCSKSVPVSRSVLNGDFTSIPSGIAPPGLDLLGKSLARDSHATPTTLQNYTYYT